MKKNVLTIAIILFAIIAKAQIDNDSTNGNFFSADTLPLCYSVNCAAVIPCWDTAQMSTNTDVDWFMIHANRGGVLVIKLRPNPLGAPILLKVTSYDYAVYTVSTSNMGGSKQAAGIGLVVPTLEDQVCAGDYYFKVEHGSGTGIGSYLISVCLDTLECECNDNTVNACLIPSDTCFDARIQGTHLHDPTLFPGYSNQGGGGTGQDNDWYQIHLLSHESVKATITHAPADQRFAIEYYSSLSTTLINSATSLGNGLDVTLGCLGLDSGIWQFKIYEYSAGGGGGDPYTLSDSTYHICFSRLCNVGINEPYNNYDFSVYPNPANSILNIKMSEENTPTLLSITNFLGETIYQTKLINEKIKTVDISRFDIGIYFIKIQNKNESSIRKFVKQ